MLLMLYIFAHLTTVMDSSSEFHQLAFAHGVTVEGQFLASLAPATRGEATCPCRAAQENVMTAGASSKESANRGKDEAMWNAGADDSQRFWRVRVRECLTPPLHLFLASPRSAARRAVRHSSSLQCRAHLSVWVWVWFSVLCTCVRPSLRGSCAHEGAGAPTDD